MTDRPTPAAIEEAVATVASTSQEAFGQILPPEDLDRDTVIDLPCVVFKPWHLPRKQLVRKDQWAKAVDLLIEENRDRKLVKYLCLPGEDLLDVEILASICGARNRRLHYLGFDGSLKDGQRSTQRISSEQILRQNVVVEDTSEVVPDDFASVARVDSRGNKYLRDGGSYDIVNLDLCDAFTSETSATHDAVVELMQHQCNHRGEPWLLFLTTRSEKSRIAEKELAAYLELLKSNATQSADFLERLLGISATKTPIDRDVFLGGLEAMLDRDTRLSGRLLALGIGKWLLGVARKPELWRVDLLSIWSYRTGLLSDGGAAFAQEPPNLFSLAFRFEKIQKDRHDPLGLAQKHTDPAQLRFTSPDEIALAEKMAKCVDERTRDLDSDLQNQPELVATLVNECAGLLATRYYSPDAYRTWVAGLPTIETST